MKKIISILTFVLLLTSCDKEEAYVPLNNKEIVGEWELYRWETLESMIDQWTGTEFTFTDVWFKNVVTNPQNFYTFYEDNTFEEFYATVKVFNGTWGKLEDGRYYYDYEIPENNTNTYLQKRRYLFLYCDNTTSVIAEDEPRRVDYLKIKSTNECENLIDYKVD